MSPPEEGRGCNPAPTIYVNLLITFVLSSMSGIDFSRAREAMVQEHLAGRDIKDPAVLSAFRRVPRERFVPPEYQQDVYGDFPLPIGFDQTISQPYIVALMIEALSLT